MKRRMKMKVRFYRDRKKEWRWQAISANGRIIADSGEGYKSKDKCLKGWDALCKGASASIMEYFFDSKAVIVTLIYR